MDSQERKQIDVEALLFWSSSLLLCGIKKNQTTPCREKEQLPYLFFIIWKSIFVPGRGGQLRGTGLLFLRR